MICRKVADIITTSHSNTILTNITIRAQDSRVTDVENMQDQRNKK